MKQGLAGSRSVVIPAGLASALYLFLVLLGLRTMLAANDGQFFYPLDDTYIHLAIAKTYLLSGKLGVTPAHYGPAASSIAWPFLILAVMKLVGMKAGIPLVLSVAAGVGAIFAAAWLFAQAGMNKWLVAVFLFLMIAIVPLPSVALLGMEHAFHVATILLVMAVAYRSVSRDNERDWIWLALTGMLAVSARYESLALLAALGGLFMLARRWKLAVAMVLSGTPALLYAVYLKVNGGEILPNSVLLKKVRPSLYPKVYAWLWNSPDMAAMLLLAALFVLAFLLRAYWTKRMPPAGYLAIATIMAVGAQAAFMPEEQLYRYEAYIHAMLFVSVLVAAMDPMFKPVARRGFLFIFAFFVVRDFYFRMDNGLRLMPLASREIRLHPGSMADFLNRYYPGTEVAVNDIGFVSWATDAKVIDMMGLANMDMMKLRRDGALRPDKLAAYCRAHGAPIAMIYTTWLPGYNDRTELKPVGELRIHSRTVLAHHRLTFLAVGVENVPKLRASLRDFARGLPPEIAYVEIRDNETK